MDGLINGTISSTDAIASEEQMGERNVRKLLPLACVSPKVIQAIVDGHAPADLTIRTLTAALPHQWAAQYQRFLIA
jgi:site-specific DNA recombinase